MHVTFDGDGVEQLSMFTPQPRAGIDAFTIEKARAIFPPEQRLLSRFAHRFDDFRLWFGLGEHGIDFFALEALGGHVLDEGANVGPLEIETSVSGHSPFGGTGDIGRPRRSG